MGIGQQGTPVQGGIQQLNFRGAHDAKLSGMGGFIPSAAYPDGYLGTIQSRREDRFLDQLKGQLNKKSYERGAHKGEKIDAADYFWPSELQPDRGLRQQAMAVPTEAGAWASPRQVPLGTVFEQMVASGATELPTGPRGKLRPPPTTFDANPAIAATLRHLSPTWR
jgi:hypothetical protein